MSFKIELVDLKDGHYALIVECFDEKIVSKFNEMGYDGNGDTWFGITESIARLTFGSISNQISHSPEADSEMAVSTNKKLLEKLGQEVERAFNDDVFLKKVIDNANPDYLE